MIADNLVLCDPKAGPVGVAFPLAPEAVVTLSPERMLRNSLPGGRVNLGWMKPVVRRNFLAAHRISWRTVRHGEDTLFALEVLLAGGRAALVGEAGYRYTQRRGSASGAASEHSRTRRDAEEQIMALETLEQVAGARISPALKRRLARMRPEIRVTTHVLHGLDRLGERRYAAAVRAFGSAASSPLALARCLAARFGPRSRTVV